VSFEHECAFEGEQKERLEENEHETDDSLKVLLHQTLSDVVT
jgi:hypothetical protein